MQIERLNTTKSANLLVDGSFEDFAHWTLFNNAFLEPGPRCRRRTDYSL